MTGATITILEGPDGAGKTFAAQRRMGKEQRATGKPAEYVHNGPPPPGITSRRLYRLYLNQMRRAVLRRSWGHSTVIDRSWPSELVYGPLFRGHSLLGPKQVAKLEAYARAHDIITVGLEEDDLVRWTRLTARGESFDGQLEVGIAYHQYFQSMGWITAGSSLA